MDAQSPSGTQARPFPFPALLGRFGVVRLLARPLGLVPLVPPSEKAYYSQFVRPQNIRAYIDERQGMSAAGAEASAVKTFGDLPLIVLTARLNTMQGWQEWQTELLQVSSNSQQLFAESDHNIQIEAPDAAIAAIVQMVEQIRSTVKK